MALTTQQQMLAEQRLSNDKKSTFVAYLLWFFLGGFGAHRFYLGKTKGAVAQLLLLIIGWVTAVIFIGFALLIALGIWLIVDAFLIPGMIAEDTSAARTRILNEIAAMGGSD
jgi:TM2 domain-containing membrane protein YozV